jgi:stress-induced-phosphoprotein 1
VAYIDPTKANEAREEGNLAFKSNDFPLAVKLYTESIRRSPSDPRGYANRAAAYIKLATFPDAVKDCDKAIELDPSFVKAHIRKASSYFGMGEYQKSLDACARASEVDTQGQHVKEIEGWINKAGQALAKSNEGASEQEILERAQRDPEVLGILQDPIMQQILGQMKEDPSAVQDHLRNPMIREKIQKLVNAGIIRMGTR